MCQSLNDYGGLHDIALLPMLLQIGSNVFMTLAWYGHLLFTIQEIVTLLVFAGFSISTSRSR